MSLYRHAFRWIHQGVFGFRRALCQPALQSYGRLHKRFLCSNGDLQSISNGDIQTVSETFVKRLSQPYKTHLSLEELRSGEAAGLYQRGVVRVNPRKYDESYIISSNGTSDILLDGLYARNRALDGDEVAYRLFPRTKWKTLEKRIVSDEESAEKDTVLVPTGEVVAVVDKRHPRICVGRVTAIDKATNQVIFSPRDHRIPRMVGPLSGFPEDFALKFNTHKNKLFLVQLTDWADDAIFASGTLVEVIGEQGDIEVETKSLLIEHRITEAPFSKKAMAELPELPYTIPQAEIKKRRDLRHEVAFTIDPETAKDMDDALHYRALPGGRKEVGVHIADVTHFVKEGSEVDNEAASRMTSVYLIQRVIPMLPLVLSEDLCSLNPHADHLTFSIIWTLDKNFQIVDEWVGRTVIQSKAKLTYQSVQAIFDNAEHNWTAEYLGTKKQHVEHLLQSLLSLRKFTKHLRDHRFENGCLSLERENKLTFVLNSKNLPVAFDTSENNSEANILVEELMLLANIAVANRLYAAYPKLALLRVHEEPLRKKVDEVVKLAKFAQVHLNPSSSKTLNASLQSICDGTEAASIKHRVLQEQLLRAMQKAEYVCAGQSESTESDKVSELPVRLHHYGLAVPLYTHFTSPIRRYADVIVHRQLTSLLNQETPEFITVKSLRKLCLRINIQDYRARVASEQSGVLFFHVYVKLVGQLEQKGFVTNVLDRSFDVMISTHCTLEGRIYLRNLPLESFSAETLKLFLTWKMSPEQMKLDTGDAEGDTEGGASAAPQVVADPKQRITMYSAVNVLVKHVDRKDSPFSVVYLLQPPPGCSSDFNLSFGNK